MRYTSVMMEEAWERNVASGFVPVRTISDSLKELEGFITSIHSAAEGNAGLPQRSPDEYSGGDNNYTTQVAPLRQADYQYFDEMPEYQHVSPNAINTYTGRVSMALKQKGRKPLAKKTSAIIPPWIDVPEHSRFFVIKSSSLENVKKSFYNGIWSSTYFGNKRLSEAYFNLPKGSKIFLFFSVNASGRFCGVAEMISGLESGLDTSIWGNNEKYDTAFKVRWIVVRDVQNRLLKQFLIPSNDMKPVTNSRDTQEIPPAICKSILKLFKYDQTNVQSFLDHGYT